MRPLKIGLTGTFSSGKSTVAEMFERCGAVVIDADRIAREAVEPGKAALQRIAEEFGPEYIQADGRLDRKRMAETAFASPERRKALNEIVHPYVIEEMDRIAKSIERNENFEGVPAMIVLDVPLLFESGLTEGLDKVVVVTVGESERCERAKRRNGLNDEETMKRVASQWPQEKKIAMADAIIDNSASIDETRRQVEALYARWIGEMEGSRCDERKDVDSS